MGQYQQWLHYREVDRHLHTQLEELSHELAQLQERHYLYEQTVQVPSEETAFAAVVTASQKNVILHALIASMNGHPSSNGHISEVLSIGSNTSSEVITPELELEVEPGSTISPALFAQSNLPNFETPTVHADAPHDDTPQFTSYLDQQSLQPIPHHELDLLPEDMAAFFDQHTSTDPQIELPWWLRNITNTANGSGPIDQESIRTNRLVQRWLERWGKQPPLSQKSGENQP